MNICTNSNRKPSRSPLRHFLLISSLLATSVFSVTRAAEPFTLDDQQMDTVSAGSALEVAASVDGTASAMNDLVALTGVQSEVGANTDINGEYRVATVFASGVSYACCNGGDTSLDVSIDSNADTQIGFIKIFSINTPLISAKIGGGGIIAISRR